MLRNNDVIIVVGAGCSHYAGIPTSDMMLTRLHHLLENQAKWMPYHALYCCLRGLILQADAMQGKFNDSFNIERLVASLGEIEHRRNNMLNPFIDSLHPELQKLAGSDGLKLVTDFRRTIVEQLREWVQIPHYEKAAYYANFFDFAEAYTYPLRIFTFNYDLCMEKTCPSGKVLERGFDEATHQWDYRRFEPNEAGSVSVYYYKMHGSVDWERDANHGNIIRCVDNTPSEPDLIFGTVNKLYPFDPYLFYAYELRQYSLMSKIILVIGFSFADEYVNRILRQALENDPSRRIVAVMPKPDEQGIKLRLGEQVAAQVKFVEAVAEEFLKGLAPEVLEQVAGLHTDTCSDPFTAV